MKNIPPKIRISALTTVMGVLAITSYHYNSKLSEKQIAAKEKELVQTIQYAKMQAVITQRIPKGTMVLFAHLAPVLKVANSNESLNKIALGTENGIGKNLISWGTFPEDGNRPPKFSQGAPVTK